MTAKHDHNARRDEIDVIIDDILADPTRAGELKALLRRHFVPRPPYGSGGLYRMRTTSGTTSPSERRLSR